MMHLQANLPDAVGTNFRAVVATLAGRLPSLPGLFSPQEVKTVLENLTDSLRASMNQVVLGKKPKYRECPKCSHLSLRRTILCSDCWSKVTELDPLAPCERLG